MLKIAFASFLQHIQAQNTWAQALLKPLAGQCIAIDCTLMHMKLVILETGEFTVAGETTTPDATLSMRPTTLLRLAAKDDLAKNEVNISGDTALASTLAKVLSQLRWDIADDLSHAMGDVASEKLVSGLAHARDSIVHTKQNIGEMTKEYLTEEAMLIAKTNQLNAFNESVDALKADTARLEKRIQQLARRLEKPTTP